MRYEILKPEERERLRLHETSLLQEALQLNVCVLNSLAEEPELECPGLRFVSTEWPKELREMIAAIQEELNRRHVEQL